MKIYIRSDMEGTSGLWMLEQTEQRNQQYFECREHLMGDVNAAIAGAFDGGATEVIVSDFHGCGGNFNIAKMDPRAIYETPDMVNYTPSLDSSFEGLMLIGQHSKAGTLNGFLDHTVDAGRWFEFRVNGQAIGEIGMGAAFAGHFGVPLIMVSGDEAACKEAEEGFPGVVTAAVKKALGRGNATCLSLDKAQALIQENAAKAVQKAKELKPWHLKPPITIELTFCRTDFADIAAARYNIERVDGRTIRYIAQSFVEIPLFN